MKKLLILSAAGLMMVSSVGCQHCRLTDWFSRGSGCCEQAPTCGAPAGPVTIEQGLTPVQPGPTSFRPGNKVR